jgi:hypothetical protein
MQVHPLLGIDTCVQSSKNFAFHYIVLLCDKERIITMTYVYQRNTISLAIQCCYGFRKRFSHEDLCYAGNRENPNTSHSQISQSSTLAARVTGNPLRYSYITRACNAPCHARCPSPPTPCDTPSQFLHSKCRASGLLIQIS